VLEVASITRDEAGVYTCRASNDAGNATQDVTVIVECKPVFYFSLVYLLKNDRHINVVEPMFVVRKVAATVH